MYTQKTGKLEVGRTRSGGKIVDEWTFKSPFREMKGKDPRLSVEVSICKSAGDAITFRAQGECLGRNFLEDTDIEKLRQKVEERLQAQHDVLTSAVWEDWLEVEVRGKVHVSDHWNTEQAELVVKVSLMKRWVDPVSGQAYYLNNNGLASLFPKPKASGEEDVGEKWGIFEGMNKRDVQAEYSYIPATPENLAALRELMARIDELRGRLSTLLRQDTVQSSLNNVAATALKLPAPL